MCNTNPYKELLSQKVPTDFGQGVAMQGWHSAATDPLSSSENAVQNQMGLSQRARFTGAYSALRELKRQSRSETRILR